MTNARGLATTGPRGLDTPAGERRRARASMAVSMGVHALLLAWIVFFSPATRAVDKLTEITLIDPSELDAAAAAPSQVAAAAPASIGAPTSGAAAEHTREERFQRTSRPADLTPESPLADVVQDRLAARLATMQSAANVPSAGAVSAAASPWTAAPATIPGTGGTGSAPVALRRGGGTSGPPLALNRGGGGGGTSLGPAMAAMPSSVARESEPARGGESTAKRTLAGATLMGPIADRDVIQQTTPIYPDWAKREAVEASVTLYFVVRPDGSVRENVLVQKTAGFEDFDENARAALRAWRFEALRDGRSGDQWGTITFHYKIRDGG